MPLISASQISIIDLIISFLSCTDKRLYSLYGWVANNISFTGFI